MREAIIMNFKYLEKFFYLTIAMIILYGCNSETVSLDKPLKMVLNQQEVTESETAIKNGNYDAGDFNNVFVFEGILIKSDVDTSGEFLYRFKVLKKLSYKNIPDKIVSENEIDIVSPSLSNGGIQLTIGSKYRVAAPLMPDSRFATWNGGVLKLGE